MSTIQNIPEWIQMAVNHALMKIINKYSVNICKNKSFSITVWAK